MLGLTVGHPSDSGRISACRSTRVNQAITSNAFHGVELALTDVTDPNQETVVSIPQKLLEKGGNISYADLPFKIKVKSFGPNCDFDGQAQKTKEKVLEKMSIKESATRPICPSSQKAKTTAAEAMNFGYLVFELSDETGELGTWLALAHPAGNHWWKESPKLADLAFQPIRHKGKLWGVSLRAQREYLPYSIELLGIANEFYQGTETPFNFGKDALIKMDGNDTRRALVYMNTPLRHEGKTFYQYQMNKAADYMSFRSFATPVGSSLTSHALLFRLDCYGSLAFTWFVSSVKTPSKRHEETFPHSSWHSDRPFPFGNLGLLFPKFFRNRFDF